MSKNMAELEAILRDRICSICSDRDLLGNCGREEPSTCALFEKLPLVAEAIRSVDSGDIRDYLTALRDKVCQECASQYADGSCDNRTEVRCALEAYTIPIVEAIEAATGKEFDRALLPRGATDGSQNLFHIGDTT